MGTDLTRSPFGFDPICAHPCNPWLKQFRPTENVEEPTKIFEVFGAKVGRKSLEPFSPTHVNVQKPNI